MTTPTPGGVRRWPLAVFAAIGIATTRASSVFVSSGVSARPEPARGEDAVIRVGDRLSKFMVTAHQRPSTTIVLACKVVGWYSI